MLSISVDLVCVVYLCSCSLLRVVGFSRSSLFRLLVSSLEIDSIVSYCCVWLGVQAQMQIWAL